jgi:hypothetical protein
MEMTNLVILCDKNLELLIEDQRSNLEVTLKSVEF